MSLQPITHVEKPGPFISPSHTLYAHAARFFYGILTSLSVTYGKFTGLWLYKVSGLMYTGEGGLMPILQ